MHRGGYRRRLEGHHRVMVGQCQDNVKLPKTLARLMVVLQGRAAYAINVAQVQTLEGRVHAFSDDLNPVCIELGSTGFLRGHFVLIHCKSL